MMRKWKCSDDQLLRQAAAGATVSQTAKALGVSITTVTRRAAAAGITFPTKAEALKRLWAGPDGQSMSDISKRNYEARVRRIVREELERLLEPLSAIRPPPPFTGDVDAVLKIARDAAEGLGQ